MRISRTCTSFHTTPHTPVQDAEEDPREVGVESKVGLWRCQPNATASEVCWSFEYHVLAQLKPSRVRHKSNDRERRFFDSDASVSPSILPRRGQNWEEARRRGGTSVQWWRERLRVLEGCAEVGERFRLSGAGMARVDGYIPIRLAHTMRSVLTDQGGRLWRWRGWVRRRGMLRPAPLVRGLRSQSCVRRRVIFIF